MTAQRRQDIKGTKFIHSKRRSCNGINKEKEEKEKTTKKKKKKEEKRKGEGKEKKQANQKSDDDTVPVHAASAAERYYRATCAPFAAFALPFVMTWLLFPRPFICAPLIRCISTAPPPPCCSFASGVVR